MNEPISRRPIQTRDTRWAAATARWLGRVGFRPNRSGLWWATPFSPWEAAGLSPAISLTGFGGGLVMSAIKRDRDVKDWGQAIEGHGGVLDRIDSLCFAAPMCFHLTRYYFTA